MHVHFLIITYIHILCIFSELVSQCVNVHMTQFFYILIYRIHVKVYCYCPISNCHCPISNCHCPISNCHCLTLNCHYPISNCHCLTLNCKYPISNCYCLTLNCHCPTLIRFLTISKVLKLHFK